MSSVYIYIYHMVMKVCLYIIYAIIFLCFAAPDILSSFSIVQGPINILFNKNNYLYIYCIFILYLRNIFLWLDNVIGNKYIIYKIYFTTKNINTVFLRVSIRRKTIFIDFFFYYLNYFIVLFFVLYLYFFL